VGREGAGLVGREGPGLVCVCVMCGGARAGVCVCAMCAANLCKGARSVPRITKIEQVDDDHIKEGGGVVALAGGMTLTKPAERGCNGRNGRNGRVRGTGPDLSTSG